jgi:endonuclease/exonuclease/phosphatase family metal-dependent hydrolase
VKTLRVATLNICNRSAPWEERLALIRRELAALSPDIVGLQEVLRSGSPLPACLADEVAQGLGYEVVFGPAQDLGAGLWFGNAVLSRFPIAESRNFVLPVGRVDDGRGLLCAFIEAPCGRIPFFVTHLSYRLHESAVRLRQVLEIAARVHDEAPVEGFPPILVGDFNAEPDSDEIRFLRGLAVADWKSVYFLDAYAAAGEPPGHTWDNRNPFAAQFNEISRRLDYIFVRGPDRAGRGKVMRASLAWNLDDGGLYPSDHFGVVAEVRAAPGDVVSE